MFRDLFTPLKQTRVAAVRGIWEGARPVLIRHATASQGSWAAVGPGVAGAVGRAAAFRGIDTETSQIWARGRPYRTHRGYRGVHHADVIPPGIRPRATGITLKLLSLGADQLLAHASLPFAVFTEDGRLLLPAHAQLRDPAVQARLRKLKTLHVQPGDHDAWCRGLARAVDGTLRRNAPLLELARARPELTDAAQPVMPGEKWENVVVMLDKAMQSPSPGGPWLARVLEIHAHVRRLAVHHMDEALFYFVYTGSCRWSFYSSRQALRCMFIAGEAARLLGWDDARIALLDHAALTMNVAVWRLQDRLTHQAGAIDDRDEHTQMEGHPAASARLLHDSGVTSPAWLEAVWRHHDASLEDRPLPTLGPGQQAALLLRRVDCYSAMLSRRARCQPLSALQAAQQACLGKDGRPDSVGSVLLKAVGLYPPGTFVSLASSEHGIVLERGEHANAPVVAALTNRSGMVMSEPRLRYTSQKILAVCAALPYGKLHVEPSLDQLHALRIHLRSR